MPTIELPDDELAAVIAVIGRIIETDRYPRAPRLDPLRAARLEAAATSEPTPPPKASSTGKGGRTTSR